MALEAVRRDLFPVGLAVAAKALARQAQVCACQVLRDDLAPLGDWDVLRRVTTSALQTTVPAFEDVAGLAVIEFIQVHVPANRNEVFPVMLGVTASAVTLVAHLLHQGRMQTTLRSQPRSDFRVTIETPELSASRGKRVASGALSRPVQRLVRLRE